MSTSESGLVCVLCNAQEFAVLIGLRIVFDRSPHYFVLSKDDHIRKHPSGVCEPH